MTKKTIQISLFVLLAIGFSIYVYWNKPHRNVKSETALTVSADSLFAQYNRNEEASNAQYLNKAIEVSGLVAEIKSNQNGMPVVFLKTSDPLFGVQCTFVDAVNIVAGQTIKAKGLCTGFASDVVLKDCYLLP